ncbi:hypothetical protein EG339_18540 [Chryseobacterium bernardetii]|uniref:Uncharacterized protein n=1 Tax=Chryseobacterium bernardetii TaxID=1241978 RepID=A0A3G6TK08_9FLAO|nr:hypothetical protein [Chryseobacterium bernardetii]AZB26440.1 hypothetical protein EG339_18540 [Chryseobacterium bernardetii]
MIENYIQYAGGYQKDNIGEKDIVKAIKDIQLMDDEHGAFWVSVITDNEHVIEVNKNLSLSVIFEEQETRYQAIDWEEVAELYKLLLLEKFDEIASRIKL